MAIQPHAYAPEIGSVRCAVCNSPRLAMIHTEPDGSYKKSLKEVIENARAGVPPSVGPFPSEPAPGSPEAEVQAADVIRGLAPDRDQTPALLRALERARAALRLATEAREADIREEADAALAVVNGALGKAGR